MKHGCLNYFKDFYEKFNFKKDKNTDTLFIKILMEIFCKNIQNAGNILDTNIACVNFPQQFKNLFSQNINVTLKIWENNVKNLELFKQNFVLISDLIKLIKVRDNFLIELKSIETLVVDNV